ncbi:hypothetical protein [Streptomyces phage Psst4]|uniref:Uncharacterized protein n=4 Tax=Rimavirus drgrey TaxID=2560783 RepID=A0A649VVR2_9CAUD|nr:hypothetical protein FDI43_gp75 [Streptomyces phage DrGrey]QAY17110.1 hypothetical protein SEA_POPY_77 [Streptomyces phage Popy]QEQ94691.1 hypothetical protein SEA_SOSHI_78 [Streptomyces phage Soshi]QGJ96617.1 hypothetical protein SEA_FRODOSWAGGINS_77 [Streptomyces phage FrodoSwaggins]WPJ30821.1 hypothetical protein [Streptomyces phage Psst4]ASU03987.1 hypothetical protein SEA_DRGREY_75 [Streptomyces phage DrGrey]
MTEGEIQRLGAFMSGQDRPTYARMITFFSVPGKYLHPREIEHFRNSMTDEEWIDFKVEFWDYMLDVRETEYEDVQRILETRKYIQASFAA